MDETPFPDEPLQTRTEAEGATVDLPEGLGFFTSGQVLGDRYEILEMLGKGGMGEVWRAFDLKLRVEVGLKALRDELFQSERRLELLRQEVRVAREVVSPNVCRIFDLIEIDGRELVSMEFVDGATLLGVLQERGPLELKEAQDIASQFLAGLEAIHKAGLVHRDIKPENIMLTRAGRVVVMDFGLARGPESGAGSVSGTPAYMAPEHAAGQDVDARADVYSAGVVLAEMVSPDGVKSYASRQSVWEGVRSEPAKLPDSPWAPVIKRAVAHDRERRQSSAHTLVRELEDVTLRVEGADDLHPYPGLATFTEEDAEYFFGREAEIEQMWRKLKGPTRMLALVGPSGAGKSSFLRAGLISAKTAEWAVVVSTPGSSPTKALANALVERFSGDAEAMKRMLDFDQPDVAVEMVGQWRRQTDRALLVVDQFEELFTQNTDDEQHRYADLLNRFVLEADVHVLLSMRDDFFFRCHRFRSLAPLQDGMTLIGPPVGGALRRALVQPTTKCGYRFEDDDLVEEMLAEVEGERGALPLLAFATARLWEKRDRDAGLLARQAYHDIGGVGGALSRHAEATVEHIGVERIPIVRELFRNLVTSEGTRAVREWDELLSVFERSALPPVASEGLGVRRLTPHSEQSERSLPNSSPASAAGSEVLRELIDARLLTSYEVREDENEPTRHVEIIHESLLANWPRLVRWQTQDADSSQLREQLRQAARTWSDRNRSTDLLWAGAAYREYAVWRERYPGGLTELEEAFTRAMTAHAKRIKRRRRAAVAVAFVILLALLAVVGVSRQQAVAAAEHAKASELITLGRVALEADHTEALAYAIASLDRADSAEGRRLALRALLTGPPATLFPDPLDPGSGDYSRNGINPWGLAISPDGRFLAAGYPGGLVQVFSRDGKEPRTIQAFDSDQGEVWALSFSSDGRLLVGGATEAGGEVRVWETEGLQLQRAMVPPEPSDLLLNPYGLHISYGFVEPDLSSVLTVTFRPEPRDTEREHEFLGRWLLRRWPLAGGPPELVGELGGCNYPMASPDVSRSLMIVGNCNNEFFLHRLGSSGREPPRIVARHPETISMFRPALDPVNNRVAVQDESGTILLWPLDGDGTRPEVQLYREDGGFAFDTAFSPDGARLAQATTPTGGWFWDLHDPVFIGPVNLAANTQMREIVFSPNGHWVATTSDGASQRYRVALWALSDRHPRRLLPELEPVFDFLGHDRRGMYIWDRDPDYTDDVLLWWPTTGGAGVEPTVLSRGDVELLAVDPQNRFVIVDAEGGARIIPLDGSAPTIFEDVGGYLRLDQTGRYLATCANPETCESIAVLDLVTGKRLEIRIPGTGSFEDGRFDGSGRLLVVRGDALSRLDPETGATEILLSEGVPSFRPLGDGRLVSIGWTDTGVRSILDTEDGSLTPLAKAHQPPCDLDFDSTGTIAISGHPNGEIRVGPLFSEEVHLLLGHDAGSTEVFLMDPENKWLVSRGADDTTYLWPMPDVSEPPFHTLPYAELTARLKALTNLRAVPDESSYSGYRIEPDFATPPTWGDTPGW